MNFAVGIPLGFLPSVILSIIAEAGAEVAISLMIYYILNFWIFIKFMMIFERKTTLKSHIIFSRTKYPANSTQPTTHIRRFIMMMIDDRWSMIAVLKIKNKKYYISEWRTKPGAKLGRLFFTKKNSLCRRTERGLYKI